jgi:hypothetical protein
MAIGYQLFLNSVSYFYNQGICYINQYSIFRSGWYILQMEEPSHVLTFGPCSIYITLS